MPFAIKASVDVKDLLARLDGMKRAVRTRVLRKAIGAGTKIILKVAKSLVPKESGLLRKSLGRKVKVYRNSGIAVGIVGPRKGFRQDVTRSKGKWFPVTAISDPIKYAHLVEFGTQPHSLGAGSSLRKKVQHGHMHPGAAAHPFLRPGAKQATAAVRTAMEYAIIGELAKANGGP